MQKVNTREIEEHFWQSPKEKYAQGSTCISEALGRDPASMDLTKRHPFDVEITRVPPGKLNCPYHSHSAQWEFYCVISGQGFVRHAEGRTPIGPGDAFLFQPGEAHQIGADGPEDLIFYVIADNPIGESHHFPDSGKWAVRSPARRMMRSENLDYLDGEE
jgi:uncharacterized cupin superfamily protein